MMTRIPKNSWGTGGIIALLLIISGLILYAGANLHYVLLIVILSIVFLIFIIIIFSRKTNYRKRYRHDELKNKIQGKKVESWKHIYGSSGVISDKLVPIYERKKKK